MSSTKTTDVDRINQLQWRFKRLENFIGDANRFQQKKIQQSVQELNEKVAQHASSNNHARNLVDRANEVQHLTSSEFQRRLIADRATKLELILADEGKIREISEVLSKIENLARVLDEKTFAEIPKLSVGLNKLLTEHHQFKDRNDEFLESLTSFLQNYAAFTLMMDENLQQYKQILKNQQASAEIEDRHVE